MLRSRLVFLCLFSSAAAFAQPAAPAPPPAPTPTNAEQADQLFQQARALLEQHQAAQACPLLEKSYELDPGRGTLLNLAACYKEEGHSVDALRTFQEVLRQAQAASDQARIDASTVEITALHQVVHRIEIVVTPPAPDGLVVSVNDKPVPPAEWSDWPVEPGAITIRAIAPGHDPNVQDVTLPPAPGSAPVNVTIPQLAVTASTQPPPPPPPVTEMHRQKSRVILAGAVTGAGVVLFGASVVVALGAKSDWKDARDNECGGNVKACSTQGLEDIKDARSKGTLASGLGIAGLAAVAGGVVLYLTAPKVGIEHPPAVSVVPTSGGAFVQVGGAF